MITDIPSSNDFLEAGIDYLNLAWDKIIYLIIEIENIKISIEQEKNREVEEFNNPNYIKLIGFIGNNPENVTKNDELNFDNLVNKYWKASQRELSNALALIQQGIELLLKARIAEVSPFLLILGNSNLPKKYEQENISFSSLKTIDAQNLISINNIFSNNRLDNDFKEEYDSLRTKRNSLMHGVDKTQQLSYQDLLIKIFYFSKQLISSKNWIRIRYDFLSRQPSHLIQDYIANYELDYLWITPEYKLYQEITILIKYIQDGLIKEYLNFDKNKTQYICTKCQECRGREAIALGLNIDLAQLVLQESYSTEIYCIICDSFKKVVRENCIYDDCKSNVIDSENILCLICNRHQ
jgi:hypothetical protein